MNILILFLSVFSIIITICLIKKKQTPAMILSVLLLTPLVLFEYFALLWIWGGNGTFNLFVLPILFFIFLVLSFLVIRKYKEAGRMKYYLSWIGVIVIIPIISVSILYIMGLIFKVDVFNIH